MVWWCEKSMSFENYAEPLKTDYDVKQAIGNSEVIVIGFFKDLESQAAKDFLKAARDYEEYRVSFTTDQEAMKRLEVIYILNKFLSYLKCYDIANISTSDVKIVTLG